MTELTIVAHIQVDPAHVADIKPHFDDLVAGTRTEDGCITYVLHQDNDDPGHFMVYETWTNRPLWQDHMVAPCLKTFQSRTEGMITSAVIHEMTVAG